MIIYFRIIVNYLLGTSFWQSAPRTSSGSLSLAFMVAAEVRLKSYLLLLKVETVTFKHSSPLEMGKITSYSI